jgi:hypothetical protein
MNKQVADNLHRMINQMQEDLGTGEETADAG